MIRRFIETNYIKGQLYRLSSYESKVKTTSPKRNVQIFEFNEEDFSRDALDLLYGILGIDKYNPYRELNLAREILDGDKEGYVRLKSKFITKQTEKAIYIGGCWLPKSQVIIEPEYTYIKDWMFEKNVMLFNF